jgi:hypothetical protein
MREPPGGEGNVRTFSAMAYREIFNDIDVVIAEMPATAKFGDSLLNRP